MTFSLKQLSVTALSIVLLSTMPLRASDRISDMGRAVEYCDRMPLEKIEGIWEFPEDNTTVLIRRANRKQRVYELIIVSSPDCRLKAGEKIGEMAASVDSDKFRLSLYTSRRDGILTDPSNCLAVFNDKDGAIRVEKRKFKISLRFTRYLPKFWRLLSLLSSDNPTDKLHKGLIRIYPTRSGRVTDERQPIYL